MRYVTRLAPVGCRTFDGMLRQPLQGSVIVTTQLLPRSSSAERYYAEFRGA
jgi:hypothetical protein